MNFFIKTQNIHNFFLPKISSDFIEDWVKICKAAKAKVRTECSNLDFNEQCTQLEKVNYANLFYLIFYFTNTRITCNDEIKIQNGTSFYNRGSNIINYL